MVVERRVAARARAYPVGARFWERFVAADDRPSVFRRLGMAPIAGLDAMFMHLVRIGDDHRAGRRDVTVRLYRDGCLAETDFADQLPRADDGSLGGYHERMKTELAGRRYGLVVNAYEGVDPDLWLNARDFLAGLVERRGPPPAGVECNLFIGNYEHTPFGVHKDMETVFDFVLAGRKRMVVWPFDEFADMPGVDASLRHGTHALGTNRYEAHRHRATVLDGEPGDVIYWPPDCWHVAEGETDEIVIAVGVSLGYGRPPWEPLVIALSRMLRAAGAASTLPRALAKLREVVAGRELETLVAASSAAQTTGFGFHGAIPQRDARAIEDRDVLLLGRSFPVTVTQRAGRLWCSANGRVFEIPRSARPAIDLLNRGRPVTARRLIQRRRSTRDVLEMLFRVRAIECV